MGLEEETMTDNIKVIHYLNQFFGGLGGEEQANIPVQVRQGVVGPGQLLQQTLGDQGTIVATVIAGDNYFVEEEHASSEAVLDAFQTHQPDVVVAGPAFDAGRYGLACAQMCKLAQQRGIPAVTAMTPDNTGVITYRRHIIAVPTGSSPVEMPSIMARMARIALKLGRGEPLGTAHQEDYLPRGLRKPVVCENTGARRAVDMMEARLLGQPFRSEVFIQEYDVVSPPSPLSSLQDKTIALVTSGGMVPDGNPDRLGSARAESFFRYNIAGLQELKAGEWISVHGGFNTRWLNTKDPNYALPLRTIRETEAEGGIGKIYEVYFATTGNQTAVTEARRMGREIADELQEQQVDAALLVAT
jgi:glycine reductase